MTRTLTDPSPEARHLASALGGVSSVRDVFWTPGSDGDHLWVCIQSWDEDDYFPVVRARDEARGRLPDRGRGVQIHVYAEDDKTDDGEPDGPPDGARKMWP